MRNTFFLMIATLILVSGCATQKTIIAPSLTIIDMPKLGEERTSELGETLVEKGKVYTYDGVRLENTVSAGDGFILKKFTLQPCSMKANMYDDDRIYYTTDKLEVYDALLGTHMQIGGLAISKSESKQISFHTNGIAVLTPSPEPILTKVKITDLERPNFRQELIYNGRSGDTLKFLYREYTSEILRAPFSQDVQYDLKDGKTIGFKGARLEIIDATNIKLKYRVLSSFPDAL